MHVCACVYACVHVCACVYMCLEGRENVLKGRGPAMSSSEGVWVLSDESAAGLVLPGWYVPGCWQQRGVFAAAGPEHTLARVFLPVGSGPITDRMAGAEVGLQEP